MADGERPVNFGAGKAFRSGDSSDWSPRDLIEQLLAEIDSGSIDWDRVLVIGVKDTPDGQMKLQRWRARVNRQEEAHLLVIATHLLASGN